MKIRYVLILACFMPLIKCDFVRMPKVFDTLSVYHIKRAPIEDINACYRALFDACNIEESCGNSTKYSDYETFFKHLKSKKIDYQALRVVVNTIPAIAKEQLGLNVFCVNAAGYFTSVPFPEGLGKGLSAIESAQIISKVMMTEHEKCQQTIEQLLSDSSKECIVIHFLYPTGTSLALLSLVQTKQGRTLLVCNENNTPLGRLVFGILIPCPVMSCVSDLTKKFAISTREDLNKTKGAKVVSFPYRWSSIPQSFVDSTLEKVDPLIQLGKVGLVMASCYGLYHTYYWVKKLRAR